MKRNDPQFNEMAARILSGQLTRQQASIEYNLNYGTISVWLSRSKLTSPPRPDGGRALYGTAVAMMITDPDKVKALDAAVERVLAGEISAAAAAALDARLSHRTIAAKVRKARQKLGLPVQVRGPRGPNKAQPQQ